MASLPIFRSRWIVSAKFDLVFFIGSVLSCFFLYGFHLFLVQEMGLEIERKTGLISFIVFLGLFDLPHIFQTFSRTHADKDEYERHRHRIFWGLVICLALGEIMLFLRAEEILFAVGEVYGIWHVLKQNVGFVRIYKGLHKDFSPIDDFLDSWVLYLTVLAGVLPLKPLIVVALIVNALFVLRQLQLVIQGKPLNLQKLLFVGSQVPLYWFLFYWLNVPILLFIAIDTIYHDIQYHGWMWIYQTRRFENEKPGFAKRWAASCLGLGILVAALTYFAFIDANASYFSQLDRTALAVFFVPVYMLVIYHYYIDGVVWKFKESPELRAVLASSPTLAES